MTLMLRYDALEETLLSWLGNFEIIFAEWHSPACCTLWLLDDMGRDIHCRFNRGLSGIWTLIPLRGIPVGEACYGKEEEHVGRI